MIRAGFDATPGLKVRCSTIRLRRRARDFLSYFPCSLSESTNPATINLTAHLRASDLNMTKRYLALTGEDLKAEYEKATSIGDIVGKRVRRV